MDHIETYFKIGAGAIGGLASYLYGGWEPLLQILLVFVVIDYVTGIIAAGYQGKLSSEVGFKGIARKIMIFVLVAVAHLIDGSLGENHFFRDAVIYFYMANELLSIIENAGRTGLPIPQKLKNAVEILKGKDEENGQNLY